MKAICFVLFACLFAFAPLAQAQRAGVINDPAGFVDVRAEKNADAAVIATVKTGEPFTFESENDADWCKVTLASGKSGWMQLNSIRLYLPRRICQPAKKIRLANRRSNNSRATEDSITPQTPGALRVATPKR